MNIETDTVEAIKYSNSSIRRKVVDYQNLTKFYQIHSSLLLFQVVVIRGFWLTDVFLWVVQDIHNFNGTKNLK